MRDIQDKEDIKLFVDAFYQKVRIDKTIGPVFAAKIVDDNWSVHLERMYGFWNTVLFAQREYRGNPFAKHAPLPIEKRHFERWEALFYETIDDLFEGPKAAETKTRVNKMSLLFQSKLEYLRNNSGYKNII